MSPLLQTTDYREGMSDFSGGLVSGISERKMGHPRFVRRANNLIGRPHRAMSVRNGSRDIVTGLLANEPHSLMKFYSSTSSALFAANGTAVHLVGDPYVPQTLPYTPSAEIWTHENLNGIMTAAQRFGSEKPVLYNGQWLTMVLPKPALAPTFAADTAGGSVDAGTHFYRVRWRYTNGSSLVGPVSAAHLVVDFNNTVNLNANLVPPVPRSDYLGWRLERSKVNGNVTGPFYFVADGTATTYADTTADADLGYRADEGLHGEPLHLDGLTVFNDRLLGWAGSMVYLSQLTVDAEATGICNWDAELAHPFLKDDGDSIQTVIVVADQALILKRRSVGVLDGDSQESFRLTAVLAGSAARGAEAGAVGPRAAAAIGNTAYFYGDGGLFRYARGTIKPFGWVELGHYKDQVNTAALASTLLVNYLGDFLLVWLPMSGSQYPNEICVWDQRFDEWWHWDSWQARDAIVQKDEAFGGATLIFADPKAVETASSVTPADPSAFIWRDNRTGTRQIFGHQVLPDGTKSWLANGQILSSMTATGNIGQGVASDYAGGWYYAWIDSRSGTSNIRIQRLTSAGTPYPGWPSDGFILATAIDTASALAVAPDGVGGCFVSYVTEVTSAPDTVTVARVGPLGAVVWVGSCNPRNVTYEYLAVQPDGSGGCFIYTKDGSNGHHVYKLSSGGAHVWSPGGVDLQTPAGTASYQSNQQKFCLDGAGGLYVVGNNGYLLARLSATNGSTLWSVTVAPLSSPAPAGVADLAVCPDLEGGCIVVWRDSRGGALGVYAQRFNAAGAPLWTVGGVQLQTGNPTVNPVTYEGSVVPDGTGGACFAWTTHITGFTEPRCMAQRLSNLGARLWGQTPLNLGENSVFSSDGVRAATDGGGGMIVTWGNPGNILVQRVDSGGAQRWGAGGMDLVVGMEVTAREFSAVAFSGTPEGTSGQPITEGYHLWAGVEGFGDFRTVTGAGGVATKVYFESPKLDGGMPDRFKRLLRLGLDVQTDVTIGASIITEPGEKTFALTFDNAGNSFVWADELNPSPNDLEWDVGEWGIEEPLSPRTGIPPGVRCKRYRVTVSAACDRAFSLNGFDIDGVLLPESRTDR